MTLRISRKSPTIGKKKEKKKPATKADLERDSLHEAEWARPVAELKAKLAKCEEQRKDLEAKLAGQKKQIEGLRYWHLKHQRIINCEEHNHPVPPSPGVCVASDCPLCQKECRRREIKDLQTKLAAADEERDKLRTETKEKLVTQVAELAREIERDVLGYVNKLKAELAFEKAENKETRGIASDLEDRLPRADYSVCEGNECGGCEGDDAIPCAEFAKFQHEQEEKLDAICEDANMESHSWLKAKVAEVELERDAARQRARSLAYLIGASDLKAKLDKAKFDKAEQCKTSWFNKAYHEENRAAAATRRVILLEAKLEEANSLRLLAVDKYSELASNFVTGNVPNLVEELSVLRLAHDELKSDFVTRNEKDEAYWKVAFGLDNKSAEARRLREALEAIMRCTKPLSRKPHGLKALHVVAAMKMIAHRALTYQDSELESDIGL